MRLYLHRIILLLLGLLLALMSVVGCSQQKKVREIIDQRVGTSIEMAQEVDFVPAEVPVTKTADTITVVNLDGTQMFLMKTIQDEDGTSVVNEELEAAVVTARFRHLSEHNGKVDLAFQIIVPEKLMDDKWQLRYQPTMYVLEDSTTLEKVFVTGKDYRKRQLRGYEQYERFLNKIITDSLKFVAINRLELFLQRNVPSVYAFKTDTSFVSDEQFEGEFGVTEKQALDHYTSKYRIKRNNYLIRKKGKMYQKYIKAPIETEGLRIDSVLKVNGNFVYNYVQELNVQGKSKLKKVDIVLDGEVFEYGNSIYKIPRTEPLTFYISSISSFVDDKEKFITEIKERRAQANTSYNIEFAVGKTTIDPKFAGNGKEISNIKEQLRVLLKNDRYYLDSVTVCACASPEGYVDINASIAKARSQSITDYFNNYIMEQIDSLQFEEGMQINVEDNGNEVTVKKTEIKPIRFISRYVSEDWDGLTRLIDKDVVMTAQDKESYHKYCEIEDLDLREAKMKKERWYPYVRNNLYNKLRGVRFDFILQRKYMAKDTLVSTRVDSVYSRGLNALKEREYETALEILLPYHDFNTAIALCALDRNYSALEILEKCERTAEVNYILAIIYSRLGDDEAAVQCYVHSCEQKPIFKHRGNLDPEISVLIKKYNINKIDDNY